MLNSIIMLLLLTAIVLLAFNFKPVSSFSPDHNAKLAEAYKNKADAFENLSIQQEKLLDAYRERLGIKKETTQ